MKLKTFFLRALLFCWLPLILVPSPVVSQEINVEELVTKHLLPVLKEIGEDNYSNLAPPKPTNSDEAAKRLDAASWNLMLGETLAVSRRDLTLWTGAVDSLEEGLASMEALQEADDSVQESLISLDADSIARADTEAETELLEEQRRLVMKFDVVIARRDEIQKRLGLARDQEWSRLNQLRKLSIAYRDLVNGMAMADFYRQVGDLRRAKTHLSAALAAAESITQTVEARNDYYLFTDEVRGDREEADEKYDFNLVSTHPRPLAVKLVPHIKSLHAMAIYRLATSNADLLAEDTEVAHRKALLTMARDLAQDVISDDSTVDPNPIAYLANGWSELALGLLETHLAPHEDNAVAKAHFAVASTSLNEAHRQIVAAEHREPTVDALARRVQTALDRLGSSDWFLAKAQEETVNGQPNDAYQTLRQAALVHRSKQVWFAMLTAGLRAGLAPSNLQRAFDDAVASGLIDERDEEAVLLSARLTGAKVWHRVSLVGLSGIQTSPANEAESELDRLREELDQKKSLVRSRLADTSRLRPGSIRRAQYQSMGVYLLHLSDMLSLDVDRPSSESAEIQQFARNVQDARRVLHTAIGASDDAWQTLGLRESRIQLYLAVGYMASRFLEEYTDDAMIAYMAAYDDISALPYSVKYLKGLGTPLLKGIEVVRDRSPDDRQKLLSVERERRQQMTRFVEGMYVVHFGMPEEGAEHMQLSLRSAGGAADSTSARTRFLHLNGFTDKLDHETAIQAFAVLAYAEAGNWGRAIRGALDLLKVPRDPLQNLSAQLDMASSAVESPLTGFALAQALHSRIQQYDIADSSPERNELIRHIKIIHDKIAKLGAVSPYYETRYPHLLRSNHRQATLYRDESLFVNEAVEANLIGNLDAVVERTEAGLKHHPESKTLWKMHFAGRVERLQRGDAPKDRKSTLAMLDRAIVGNIIPQYIGQYYRGVILEFSPERASAVAAYREAAQSTRDAKSGVAGDDAQNLLAQQIRAESKVVELDFLSR